MSNTPDTTAQPTLFDTLPAALPPQGDDTAIARQAIVDVKRNVVGYELFDRSKLPRMHTAATDAELLFNVMSHADNETLAGKKNLFINCTLDSLSGGHLDLIQPDRLVLEIPLVTNHDAEEIETRRQLLADTSKRGFKLAFSHQVLTKPYAPWLQFASFIKFDLLTLKPEAIEPFVRHAQKHSSAQLVAEKVETEAQYETLKALGITLFQGYWFAKPVLVKGQTIRPAQANIIQLINLVRKQASTNEIEDVLKRDPTLSFNLLRFINSASFGLSVEITSFRHAVMILGLKKLFRWAALLMATSRVGGAAPAVGSMAVVRGRLMELLAAELLTPEDCDNAFVVGIFSLLDTMLGMPMDKALESIALPEPVMEALLHQRGVLAPFLALTLACESEDEAAFGKWANELQLNNRQVNWAHLQALAWADTLTEAE
jgi:c-di-GMP-related signal transduction protein